MTFMNLVAGATLFLGFSVSAHAAPGKVCFHDVREFEAVRAQLPVVFQNGSVHAVHKSFTMKGGFRVYQAGSRFVIEAKGQSLIGRLDEDQNIKALCVEGAKVSVWLDDGRYDEITIEPKGFRFHNFLFKVTSPDAYQRMIDSL